MLHGFDIGAGGHGDTGRGVPQLVRRLAKQFRSSPQRDRRTVVGNWCSAVRRLRDGEHKIAGRLRGQLHCRIWPTPVNRRCRFLTILGWNEASRSRGTWMSTGPI
jgi:hypothetical protein